MEFRLANLKDIPQLIQCRKNQLIDEGAFIDVQIDKQLNDFYTSSLSNNTITQYVAEENKKIVSIGALIIYQFPPSFTNPTGKKAYIAGIYTRPNYRNQGLASKIMSILIKEINNLNIHKVWLEASKQAVPLYEKFGFKFDENYMLLNI